MTHRQILEAMSGLMAGMFVALLSSTVVTNALPTIIGSLDGSEAEYTWVVVATLLALTISTPIWGKLSDLFSPQRLVELAIIIYVGGSLLAGAAQDMSTLILARGVQGIGMGGVFALVQIIMARMVSPRERGRYTGYLGAVFTTATVLGPLVGGLMVDTSWLGWRWCFFVGAPFALLALIVLRRTLNLPVIRRPVRIDYVGGLLIVLGVSPLLIWVSMVGSSFDLRSQETLLMVAPAAVFLLAFLVVEARVAEPIIPLTLFRSRTVALAAVGSVMLGASFYGVTVFLSQYFQVVGGASPTMAGLATMPQILGMFVTSLVVGRRITRTGRWRSYLVGGSVSLVIGLAILGLCGADTPYLVLAPGMLLVGVGVGATLQNLILAVQNSVPLRDVGSSTGTLSFVRSLGGTFGVGALGGLLAASVTHSIASGLRERGLDPDAVRSGYVGADEGLPAAAARVVQEAYGVGTSLLFLASAVAAAVGALAIAFIKEVPLRTTLDEEDGVEEPIQVATDTIAAADGVAPPGYTKRERTPAPVDRELEMDGG